MDADQNDICQFLKSWPGQFVSRKEICRRAGGKWRYREDENWALPVLQRMLENYLVESDSTGHFRLLRHAPCDPKNKKRLWISPAIRKILQQSGRSFGVLDLDKEIDPADEATNPRRSLRYQLDD
jgi:hypothetical protein